MAYDPHTLFLPGAERPSVAELDALVARYPWFAPLRLLRGVLAGRPDPRLRITAPWRAESALLAPEVEGERLWEVTPGEIIDRFLGEEDLRIVARDEGPEEEVVTSAELDDDDCLVSEELAAIYRAQGLDDRAEAIYRKLSLLNPEKSVYFAELIAGLKKQ